MRQVSASSLSHVSGLPSEVAANWWTWRAKNDSSYAPGVHAGSESRTGSRPVTAKRVVTLRTRSAAVALVKDTSYRRSLTGAEMSAALAPPRWPATGADSASEANGTRSGAAARRDRNRMTSGKGVRES